MRGMWLTGIVGSLTYFLLAVSLFMSDYHKKFVSTTTKLKEADNLTFPTITICNRNSWKYSAIRKLNETHPDIFHVVNTVFPALYGRDNASLASLNWSDPRFEYVTTEEGKRLLTDLVLNTSLQLDESIRYCVEKSKHLPCNQLFSTIPTDAGQCFQFNKNGSFKAFMTGGAAGISFELMVNTDEYYSSPKAYSEGFYVVIHDKNDTPLVEEMGYGLVPGFETYILLKRKKTQRMPPPADDGQADCFDSANKPNPLSFYDSYSKTACVDECRVGYIVKKCGCRDFFQPPLNNSDVCNLKVLLECRYTADGEFMKDQNHLRKCNCKSKCDRVEYSARISSFKFPSKVLQANWPEDLVADYRNNHILLTIGYSEMTYELVTEIDLYTVYDLIVADYRNNHVKLTIGYSEMTYELVEEIDTYFGYDLIANLGGTLGICIRGSFLTLAEFIEFAVLKISIKLCTIVECGPLGAEHKAELSRAKLCSVKRVNEVGAQPSQARAMPRLAK
ncbi:acid-sensing ion channel 2-like [Watersipora subatra]|uniref:acid-sensing ion channel 2-like n=1 Tax=Watersipora subatra TaxID=2589382 RepID=UPI00355BF2C5